MFQSNRISKCATPLMLAGLLGLGACASETADDSAAAAEDTSEAAVSAEQMQSPHGEVTSMTYQCADEKSFMLTLAAGVSVAALRMDDQVYQLEQQEVASGMEFSDGSITFRGEGPEGYVEKDGEQIFTDCKATGHPE